MVKVKRIFLEIKNLPPPFQNLKILHLSDLHSKKFTKKEEKILEILNQLKPDLVFITGDIIDRRTRDFQSCQEFWQELSKNYQGKIFGVYGNHDHSHPQFEKLNRLLKESQIEILRNQSRKIEINGEFIYLIGLDDPHLGYANLEKALAEVREKRTKILLVHSPEIFGKIKNQDFDLVLAGHTHGGQINIPIFSDLILSLNLGKNYKKGLFKENSIYFYVSGGIGETFLPIRINSSPETTFITLIKND